MWSRNKFLFEFFMSGVQRRLACLAAAPMTVGAARNLGYAWSQWRRQQARARWHHYHARLKAAHVT